VIKSLLIPALFPTSTNGKVERLKSLLDDPILAIVFPKPKPYFLAPENILVILGIK